MESVLNCNKGICIPFRWKRCLLMSLGRHILGILWYLPQVLFLLWWCFLYTTSWQQLKVHQWEFFNIFFSIFGAHGWLSCPCGSELFMMSLLIKVPWDMLFSNTQVINDDQLGATCSKRICRRFGYTCILPHRSRTLRKSYPFILI